MVLRMSTRSRDTEEIIRAMKANMLPAKIDRHCMRCELSVDVESRDTLLYSEEWVSEDEVKRQIRSERFALMLLLMETCGRPPDLEFEFVARRSGMEFVEAVRTAEA